MTRSSYSNRTRTRGHWRSSTKSTPPDVPRAMTTDPERRFLYLARRDANELSTYRIDHESGGLRLLGDAPLESDPCFVATDRTGRWLAFGLLPGGQVRGAPDRQGRHRACPACRVESHRRRRSCHADRQVEQVRIRPAHRRRQRTKHHLPVPIRRGHRDAHSERSRQPSPKMANSARATTAFTRRWTSCTSRTSTDAASRPITSTLTPERCPPSRGISTLPPFWNGPSTCAQIQINPAGTMLFGSQQGTRQYRLFLDRPRIGPVDPHRYSARRTRCRAP